MKRSHVFDLLLADKFTCFWFELTECLRKLLLIGVLLFYRQGTVAQLMVGLLICLGSAMMYSYFQPFKARADNCMAMVCEVSIFASLLSSLVLVHGDEPLGAADAEAVEGLLVFLMVFPLAAIAPLTIWQLANEETVSGVLTLFRSRKWAESARAARDAVDTDENRASC